MYDTIRIWLHAVQRPFAKPHTRTVDATLHVAHRRHLRPAALAHLPAVILLGVGLAACEGDTGNTGPAGPAGPQGAAGENGDAGATVFSGKLSMPEGESADTPVTLHVIDDNGASVNRSATVLTDDLGNFEFTLFDIDSPSTHLLYEATAGERSWYALVTDVEQPIDATTDGVWRIVHQIVETQGGRSVGNYTPDEIAVAVAAADAALLAADPDLNDAQAVTAAVLSAEGGMIADLSEGTIAGSVATISIAEPPDVQVPFSGSQFDLYDVNGERWDIDRSGEIWQGTGDAYDGAFSLSINGYYYWYSFDSPANIEDTREFALGPVENFGGMGLDVARKIYVPQAYSFVRFLEILHNPTAEAITVDVNIYSDLGSDEFIDEVDFSSSGDTLVDETDVWLANHMDAYDPAVGFYFAGATAQKSYDTIEYEWLDLAIPAGETVVLMHFGFQRSLSSVDELAVELQGIEQNGFTQEYFDGISTAEFAALVSAPHPPNLQGEAGSVAPNEVLTITNTNSGESTTVEAQSDGSFLGYLSVAAGDILQIAGDMGTSESVTAM